MVTIFSKSDTTFQGIGEGGLLPTSCVVAEELNGAYELTLEHNYDDLGKWKRLEKEKIIYANTPNGRQPFRIYNVKPTMEKISVNARHIVYDLLDDICMNIDYTGTAQGALNAIKNAMAYSMPFNFSTDITLSGSLNLKNINPIAAILSTDNDANSFIKSFGGELSRDHYNVSMKTSLGVDRGMVIAYGKNLVGLEVNEDISSVVTRVYPIGKDGLTAGYVDSTHINDYVYPKIYILEENSLETESDLTAAAQSLLDSGVDLPKVNITVDFELLSKTDEYKDYAFLEQVYLGDVVAVRNKKMGFAKKAKVISYEWDCILGRYNKIELGDFLPSIYNSITTGVSSGAVAMTANTDVKQVYSLISGTATVNSNGLYICIDGADINTATKLFWFGKNGLQFSSNGLAGAWKTIIDSNGNITT